ncbi:phage holin family protein [Caviibacterium pharyngocola]|uniref:Holin n=1 Tax=Caviibacterium pharyngocola TaxID=28159 RepID=A0A2M8RTA9_9PAST|nr:phage holin family protein [Caviibacterium pharyngocola]PJG82117.1 hypothetical protein CVP04_10705 [Caviibacterium pharyngocola]
MFRNSESTNAYLGSIIAFFSGLNLSDWASVLGILFGLFTVLINWYYKHKEMKLKETALKAKLNLQGLDNE